MSNYIPEYELDDQEYPEQLLLDQDREDIAELVYHAAIYAAAIEMGMKDEDAMSLAHYGTPHQGNIPHSGRHPWGSGENPMQGLAKFQSVVERLEKSGMSEKQIYKHLGFKNSQSFRAKKSIAKMEIRKYRQDMARKLKDKGMSNIKIAERLYGDPKKESTVRNLLNEAMSYRNSILEQTMNAIEQQIKENHYVDVGPGTELYLHVAPARLKTAIEGLKQRGYKTYPIRVNQLGTEGNEKTTVHVISDDPRPQKEVYRDLYQHLDKIKPCLAYGEEDETGSFKIHQVEPPVSIKSDRIKVLYAEEGGLEKDGVIQIRRGNPDLDLGRAHYAQVRIAVDGTHYIKGMAIYMDDETAAKVPKGCDILINSNKHKGTPLMGENKEYSVLKPMKSDPANPFGATIRDDSQLRMVQRHYIDPKTGEKKLSALNIVNEEGNWNEWDRTISAQMLSKQPPEVAKRQLDLTYQQKRREFDEIMAITNPTLRKMRLEEFGEGCDAAAVHLKAHGFSKQMSQVILPLQTLKDNELYAPNYENGTEVVLIRYPHAAIQEIPRLVVNNRNKEGQQVLGRPLDGIGTNAKTREQLSGADSDGDTVLVIPVKGTGIQSKPYFEELKGWDAKEVYRGYPGMRKMTKQERGMEMGKTTNLITDMTAQDCSEQDLIRAIKHSMVVIDAEKHELDWKQSEIDNHIDELKRKYQMHDDGTYGGASTLFSRASSEYRIPHRRYKGYDPETGEKIWEATGQINHKPKKHTVKVVDPDTGETTKKTEHVTDEHGKWVTKDEPRMTKSTKMYEAKDAFELVGKGGGNLMEQIYARYANSMKAMGNEARKAAAATPNMVQDKGAREVYAKEVADIMEKLKKAYMNKPLERQAQILANAEIKLRRIEKNDMTAEELQKLKGRLLNEMRARVGAKKNRIVLTEEELKAINSGALSNTTLRAVFLNMKPDYRNSLFVPKRETGMTSSQIAKAEQLFRKGHSQGDIAAQLGVSVDTLLENVTPDA